MDKTAGMLHIPIDRKCKGWEKNTMEKEPLLINVEVPFCTGRCVYCEKKMLGQNIGYLQRYRRALEIEIDSAKEDLEEFDVRSVHIRNDSLSLLGVGALDDFLMKLKKGIPTTENTQWIVDLMPTELAEEYLHVMRNRQKMTHFQLMLMGMTKEELLALKRPYTVNLVDHAIETLTRKKLPHLGVKLAIGIPGQTTEAFKASLEKILPMEPQQVSLLRYHNNRLGQLAQIEYAEETDWFSFFGAAEDVLGPLGFIREKNSLHFAKPGELREEDKKEAKAFGKMGFGLGATTCMEGMQYRNTGDFGLYLEHSDDPSQIAVF